MTHDTALHGVRRAAAALAIATAAGLGAAAHAQQGPSTADPAGDASPLAALQAILSNPTDLEHVQAYTTDDFTYMSLNYGTPEVQQVLPWAGTSEGAESLVQTFVDVSRYWTIDEFVIEDSFENEDGAAVFGRFTYTSKTLGKTVTSPFSVMAHGEGGRLSYVQFMEDTFATTRTFREGGTWHIVAGPERAEGDI